MKYIDEDLDYIYVRVGKENKSVREMTLAEFTEWLLGRVPPLTQRNKTYPIVDDVKIAMLQAAWDCFNYQPVMIKREKRKEWR